MNICGGWENVGSLTFFSMHQYLLHYDKLFSRKILHSYIIWIMLNNGGYILKGNARGVYQLYYYAVRSCTRYFYFRIR